MLLALLLLGQAAPVDAQLIIPPGKCRALLNGAAAPLDALPDRLKTFVDADAQIQFRPDPQARYACVDRVLKVVRTLSHPRLGFVGNEQYRADPH